MAESLDYLTVYDEESSKGAPTAAQKKNSKRSKSLTAQRKSHSLPVAHSPAKVSQRRTSRPAPRRNVVKRTKAQKRATAKMIAANKRRAKAKRNPVAKAKRRKSGHHRKNPIAKAGTKAGARKAAKTRAAKKAKRSRAAKKAWRTRKAGGRKSPKTAKKSKAKKGGRSHASYVKAGKKAARTRKAGKSPKKHKAKKSKAKKSKSGKRSAASYRTAARKAAATRRYKQNEQEASGTYAESRRRRAKRNPIAKARKRRRNPIARSSKGFYGIKNPIPLEGGLDFFSGVFAVTLGYLFASGADRMGSTHALTATASQGGYTDSPAAGEIYNSESTMLPIWSSGKRIAFNALSIAAPLGLSAFIKSKGPKSFFQLMAFAAIARTLGKAADDGLSMALKSTSFGLRVYAPELAAASKASGAGAAALPAAAPGVFAGVPQNKQLNGTPMADPASRPMHQAVSALPQPAFQPHAAAAPQAPIANDRPYTSGPAFNPWAASE